MAKPISEQLSEQLDLCWDKLSQFGCGIDPTTGKLWHDRRMVPMYRQYDAEGFVTLQYIDHPPPGYRWVHQLIPGIAKPMSPELLSILEQSCPKTLEEMEEYCTETLQKIKDFREGKGVIFHGAANSS